MRISPRLSDLAPGDRKFITAAASSLALEEEAARLALERSNNQAVRTFAGGVVARNKNAGAELASLAARKDASDAVALSPQHAEILAGLASTKGVAFDRAFAVQLGLQAPEDLVITFNRIARESSDGDMRAYAERLLPVLRSHQREAVQMARAAGAPRHRVQAAQDLLPPDPVKDAAKSEEKR